MFIGDAPFEGFTWNIPIPYYRVFSTGGVRCADAGARPAVRVKLWSAADVGSGNVKSEYPPSFRAATAYTVSEELA